MLFILLWGTNTLAEYCRLMPVYTTAASLLTHAWPSLLESIGRQPRTTQQLLRPCAAPHLSASLDGVSVDTDPSNQAVFTGFSSPLTSLHSPTRQTYLPAPVFRARSSTREGIPQEDEFRRLLLGLNAPSVSPMRSPTSGVFRRADTITSISLSSRASWPSDMSSIVRPLFGPVDYNRVPPRETSRRRDINALRCLHDEPADFFSSHPLVPIAQSTAPV